MIKFIGSNNSLLSLDRDTAEIVFVTKKGKRYNEHISQIEKMFLKSGSLKFVFKPKLKEAKKEVKNKNVKEMVEELRAVKSFKEYIKVSISHLLVISFSLTSLTQDFAGAFNSNNQIFG